MSRNLAYSSADSTSSRTYAWAVVGMLWCVCLFNYADRQAIFSVFPVLRSQMHLSDVQLGIVGGSFMWVYAAAGPLAGWVGDRLSRKTLILGGLIFWSLVTLATGFSTRYVHLVVFRALEGLGEAFYFPASMALIAQYHTSATRSRAMSLHQSSVYAGTILGGAAAGFFAQYFGWRFGFFLFGALGILLATILQFTLRDASTAPSGAPASAEALSDRSSFDPSFIHHSRFAEFLDFFSNPLALLLTLAFVGANFVAVVFLTWTPTFLHDKFAMNLGAAGLNATAWVQMASVLGVLTGGAIADQVTRHMHGGRRMTQAIGLLLCVPFIALFGLTRSIPLLVLAMTGFGFFKGIYDANIWAALYDVVPAQNRALSVGIMNSIGWLGAGTAPVLIAVGARHFGMGRCISATCLIDLVLAIVLLSSVRLTSRRTRDTSDPDSHPSPGPDESRSGAAR